MNVFRNSSEEFQRLDWSILQNGWSSMYWRNQILEKDIEWFQNEKYNIVEFDCRSWVNEQKMHKQLKNTLDFPDYYGENFDGLNDCLSDLEIVKSGQLVVFRHLDSTNIKQAHILLDIFANNSRRHMLFGKRLIVLIQVDDPNYQIDEVGSTPVMWNGAEWLDEKRTSII